MAENLTIKIDGDVQQYLSELNKVKKKNESFQTSLNAVAKAGTIAFAGVATAIGLAVNEAAKFETITTQFEVLTGSVETAQKTVENLQQFAANTPFQFEGIAKTGQQLLAFGFSADEMEGKLKRIGDVSAATGKPLQELGVIFGQIAGQGKLTAERLNQLNEAGVPIGPALAKTMGVAEKSIRDLVSKGEVDFKTFEAAFNSLSDEGGVAFGAMEKRSQTLEGKISTLKDNVSLLAANFGKRLLPVFKPIIDKTIELVQALNKSDEAFDQASQVVVNFIKVIGFVKTQVQNLGVVVGGGLATIVESTSAALKLNFKQAKEISSQGFQDIRADIRKNNEEMADEWEQMDANLHSSRMERKKEQADEEVQTEAEKAQRLLEAEQAREEARKEREEAKREEERAKEAEKFEEEMARLNDQSTIRTEAIREQQKRDAKLDRENKKQIIKDEIKHGKAVAKIKEIMRSAEYQGTKQAFGELQALTASNNQTLKSIGKVAAVANIVIKTAESAMNIYNGFSTIPIVGPALGIAGAAAAVAFGAEQVGKVNAANQGGQIGGNLLSPNRDSVLSFLTPGEFVTPRQNYNETVEAVADSRIQDRENEGGGNGLSVMVAYDSDEAEKIMTIQQNEANFLGTSRSIA